MKKEDKLSVLKPLKNILSDIVELYNSVELDDGFMIDEEIKNVYEFTAPFEETEELLKEIGFEFLSEATNGWQNDVWQYYGFKEENNYYNFIFEYYFCAYYNEQAFQCSEIDEFSPDAYAFTVEKLKKVEDYIIELEKEA